MNLALHSELKRNSQTQHPTADLSVHGSVSPTAGRATSVSRHPRSTLHTLPRLKGKRNVEV